MTSHCRPQEYGYYFTNFDLYVVQAISLFTKMEPLNENLKNTNYKRKNQQCKIQKTCPQHASILNKIQ